MDRIVAGLDVHIVALALGAFMLGAWQIGKHLGGRRRVKGHTRPWRSADASMALLALLIAFTFGISIERYDRRRLAAVADSNAIGDFYPCATLLPEPSRAKLQAVIRQYAQLRFDVARGPASDAAIESALGKSDEMHRQMTQLVAQALSNGTPIAVSLTNTLNAVISKQASRLSAFRDRLPARIVVLLFAGAMVCLLLIGREQASTDTHDVAGTLCFIVLVCVAVYVTLDLNGPQQGLIGVSQEPIERLLRVMSN